MSTAQSTNAAKRRRHMESERHLRIVIGAARPVVWRPFALFLYNQTSRVYVTHTIEYVSFRFPILSNLIQIYKSGVQ